MNKLLAALAGQSFTLEVTSSGDIRGVTGVDSAVESALNTMGTYPEQIRALAGLFAKQVISEPMWRQAMASVFSILAREPVVVGERWSKSFSASAQGASQVTDVYCRFLERANGVAKVKVYVDVKSLQREPAPGTNLSVKGKAEGTIEIEEATGLILRGNIKSNLKRQVTGAPGQTAPVPIAVTGASTISKY